MLFAERHRKLGRNSSFAHDRAEDLLTSTAFQLLRYIPIDMGMLAVLKKVRGVDQDGRATSATPKWLQNIDSVNNIDYAFWPKLGRFGEPDLVLALKSDRGVIGTLIIEVKLDSGKSGSVQDTENADETTDRDQLRRYWQGLRSINPTLALGVIYLTSHSTPPAQDLKSSMSRESGNWLGWLSWRDVWIVSNMLRDYQPAIDLSEILALKGLKAFDGFYSCVSRNTVSEAATLWQCSTDSSGKWFQMPRELPHSPSILWEGMTT